jgi:hypothetical protein
MAKLIYAAIASLDGYVEDEEGRFDWAAPDEEVFAVVNDLERPIGTYLYGRRMYETMVFWETASTEAEPAVIRDFAGIWRAAEKIVYSRALRKVSSFLCPILVGGGKRALPHNVLAQLELLDERRFRNGVVYLHYGVTV